MTSTACSRLFFVSGRSPFCWHEPDEKGSAALNIEAELNFLTRRPNRHDAEGNQQEHEQRREQPLPRPEIGREIPTEKDEQDQPDERKSAQESWQKVES